MKIEGSVVIVGIVAFCIGFFLGGGNLSNINNAGTQKIVEPPTPPPTCPPEKIIQVQVPVPVPAPPVAAGSSPAAVTPGNPVSVDRGPAISESQLKNDQPFVKDLPNEFLSKVVNPAAGNSILRGGQPKCLVGLSYSTKKSGKDDTDESMYDNSEKLKNYRDVSSRTMLDIGNEVGDDKVTLHHYEYGYDVYLGWPCIRKQSSKIKMMEIGLGCREGGHVQGPRSPAMWGKYLPNAQYTAVEFSGVCAKEWDTNPSKRIQGPTSYFKVYQGDQSDFNRWKVILQEESQNMQTAGIGNGEPPMYDLIVDDGGHTMLQQTNTFLALWPYIKPGGVYVIEDFQTNWYTGGHGGSNKVYGTTHLRHSKNLVKHLMDRVHTVLGGHPSNPVVGPDDGRHSGIYRVDCTHYMCAIIKRWKD